MSFVDLELSPALLKAVQTEGYEIATPIQLQAIPPILAGRDLVGCAQTGTGKTAAFALPTLQRLGRGHSPPPRGRRIRALVLAPTRELAVQIADSFRAYGRHTGLTHTVIYGGVGQVPQVRALQHGVDIVIATPGRLLDLMNQGHVNLSRIEMLILDEADQMLDMGFLRDLRRIVAAVPRERQTLLFSATMPGEIRTLADQWLSDPVSVSVVPQATTAERVAQSVFFVEQPGKLKLLANYLRDEAASRTLVFARTKHGADKLVKGLEAEGFRACAIHGNKSQAVRQRVLAMFKSQHPPVLVATDIAARGLDIDNVSHVVNFDLPLTPEVYVHRIGRTGRAGAEGIAITLCGRDERSMLREIERITRQRIPVAGGDPGPADETERPRPAHFVQQRHGQGRHGGNRHGGHRQGSSRPAFGGGQGSGGYGGGGPRKRKFRQKSR
ncbi:MAG: DEAD/DEAH box helicase [Pirellulaceae bacterium]|nr:DEAD/DEAH box helicase [Pirellulaceae bacterium]